MFSWVAPAAASNMDAEDDGMQEGSGWSQQCSCGKRFGKPNSYSNHIRGCQAYKNKIQNRLQTAQARWREKPRPRQPQVGDDIDLDVDSPAPARPLRREEAPPTEELREPPVRLTPPLSPCVKGRIERAICSRKHPQDLVYEDTALSKNTSTFTPLRPSLSKSLP